MSGMRRRAAGEHCGRRAERGVERGEGEVSDTAEELRCDLVRCNLVWKLRDLCPRVRWSARVIRGKDGAIIHVQADGIVFGDFGERDRLQWQYSRAVTLLECETVLGGLDTIAEVIRQAAESEWRAAVRAASSNLHWTEP
jgi:hypothetical protein